MRDDFSPRTIATLATRVGNVCSNPECLSVTSGPGSQDDRSVNIGVAAHITAASPKGPRFEASLTNEERRHAKNGIWLCQNCAKMIDADVVRYTIEILRRWKSEAEMKRLKGMRGDRARMDRGLHALGSCHALSIGIAAASGMEALKHTRYLNEHLGRPGITTPFGGRSDQMVQLTSWLLEESSQRALLVAPAGRGKSALAAHWANMIMEKGIADAALLPISLGFETADNYSSVSILGARLRQLRPDLSIVNALPMTSDQWSQEIHAILSADGAEDQPLLVVIIDGLDEAVQLDRLVMTIPDRIGRGTKVLVTARVVSEGANELPWKKRLHWNGDVLHVELPPLDVAGVADVVRSMGQPIGTFTLGDDLIDQLHRLTEGDPLLVRLYVDELQNKAVRGDAVSVLSLKQIRPGYSAYFDGWVRDQRKLWDSRIPLREPIVQQLLNSISCALGPLSTDDLVSLDPTRLLTSWDVREAIASLGRLVIGDGSQASGYIFSHSRLRDYFRDRMIRDEQQHYDKLLDDLCAATLRAVLKRQVAPGCASKYAVKHCREHLNRSRSAPRMLRKLIKPLWLQAWYSHEYSYNGFLEDLEKAWQQDREKGDASNEVFCALCHSSVVTATTNVPPVLLRRVLETGVMREEMILEIVRRQPSELRRSQSICAIGPLLSPPGIGEAIELSRTIVNMSYRFDGLSTLSAYLTGPDKCNVLEECLRVSEGIEFARMRSGALAKLSSILGEPLGQSAANAALRLARDSGDPGDRAFHLAFIARYLTGQAKAEATSEALAIGIDFVPDWRQRLLRALCIASPDEFLERALCITSETGAAPLAIQLSELYKLLPEVAVPWRSRVVDKICELQKELRRNGRLSDIDYELIPHLSEDRRAIHLRQLATTFRAGIPAGDMLSFLRIAANHAIPGLDAADFESVPIILRRACAAGPPELAEGLFLVAKCDPSRRKELTHAALEIMSNLSGEDTWEILERIAGVLSDVQILEVLRASSAISDHEARRVLFAALCSLRSRGAKTCLCTRLQARGLFKTTDDFWTNLECSRSHARQLSLVEGNRLLEDVESVSAIDADGYQALRSVLPFLKPTQKEAAEKLIRQDAAVSLTVAQDGFGHVADALFEHWSDLPSGRRRDALTKFIKGLQVGSGSDFGDGFYCLFAIVGPSVVRQIRSVLDRQGRSLSDECERLIHLVNRDIAPQALEAEFLQFLLDSAALSEGCWARLLMLVVACVPDNLLGHVLLSPVTAEKPERERLRVLRSIAPGLASYAKVAPREASAIWHRWLHRESKHQRPRLLSGIEALLPFVLSLGTDAKRLEAVVEEIFLEWSSSVHVHIGGQLTLQSTEPSS